jgi:hypothetical protein
MLLQRVRLWQALNEINRVGFHGKGQIGAGPVGMVWRVGGAIPA